MKTQLTTVISAIAFALCAAPSIAADVEASSFGATNASAVSYFLGDVGVGTLSPAKELEVVGDLQATRMFTTGGGMFFNRSGGGDPFLVLQRNGTWVGQVRTSGSGALGFATAGGLPLLTVVTASGNVGIGKTSPTQKLDVNGDVQGNNLRASNGGARINRNGDNPFILFQRDGSIVGQIRASGTGALGITTPGGTQILLVDTATQRVGVGTTTPTEDLHVAGTARFDDGIMHIMPLGDISMGVFTNSP